MEDWVGIDNCIRITDHLEHWVDYNLLLTHVFDILKQKVQISQKGNIPRNTGSSLTGTMLLSWANREVCWSGGGPWLLKMRLQKKQGSHLSCRSFKDLGEILGHLKDHLIHSLIFQKISTISSFYNFKKYIQFHYHLKYISTLQIL